MESRSRRNEPSSASNFRYAASSHLPFFLSSFSTPSTRLRAPLEVPYRLTARHQLGSESLADVLLWASEGPLALQYGLWKQVRDVENSKHKNVSVPLRLLLAHFPSFVVCICHFSASFLSSLPPLPSPCASPSPLLKHSHTSSSCPSHTWSGGCFCVCVCALLSCS